ncbi:MAG TPA: ABC transporter ATP-binding protein [Candidatus Sulfotelmatobacter sp.]|jgi:ABC-2 type transport system ATP-binding protein|nr:ABC transporter ATP-binding protein [Candidatus Sulfotelmatobacter sp.]
MIDIIAVKNLVKKYKDFTAVDGISFSVKQGEIFGILGPNGAGKTTTLEIMETLKPLTSGQVLIDGIDVTKHPWDVKRRIGVQLQSSAFYPEVRLTELLDMFAAMYDVTIDPMNILREVELEDKAKSYVKQLSGGQQQRFSIAATLINKPKVIFLDEPTTGLDPQARIHLWEMVRKINKAGVTIVMTTHYMDEAEQLCDRLAIMDHGKILKTDSPKSFIKDLLKSGFKKEVKPEQANLEDVFLNLTGSQLREGKL